jgi:acetyl esterase
MKQESSLMATLDPNAAQVLAAMALSGYPPLDEMSPADARAASALGFASMRGPKREVAVVREVNAEGRHSPIPLRLYRPLGSNADSALPAVVFYHGGGWVIGDLDIYDHVCRILCEASGCVVVSVDYRLAPEHKFPAAVEDAFDALQWISKHAGTLGIDPERLGVAGDSAGGNLAAVTSLIARDAGGPALKHQLLLYPATHVSGTTTSYHENAEGYFLTASLMRWFGEHYFNDANDRSDWRASPLLASSHRDLPPATVMVCGFDPLRDEGIAYEEALKQAGVATELIRVDDQIHGFLMMDGAIPSAVKYLQRCGAAVKQALA